MSEALTEHDDDTLREMLRIAAKMEAWATFLNIWHQQQSLIDNLERMTCGASWTKHTLDLLPDDRRIKLVDDLSTGAMKLRMLMSCNLAPAGNATEQS